MRTVGLLLRQEIAYRVADAGGQVCLEGYLVLPQLDSFGKTGTCSVEISNVLIQLCL